MMVLYGCGSNSHTSRSSASTIGSIHGTGTTAVSETSTTAAAQTDGWTIDQVFDASGVPLISCGSPSFCAAASPSGYASIYNGSSWSTPQQALTVTASEANLGLVTVTEDTDSLSCTADDFCAMTDTAGNVATYQNGTWEESSQTIFQINGGTGTVSTMVSCTSKSFCLAVGGTGYYGTLYEYNGTSWSQPQSETLAQLQGGTDVPQDIDCYSGTDCLVADAYDGVSLIRDAIWSNSSASSLTEKDVDNNEVSFILTCAGNSVCLAGARTGVVDFYNPGSQSWSNNYDSLFSASVTAVSCASNKFCVAGDGNGNLSIYNGATWSEPEQVLSGGVEALSCPSTGRCLAFDTADNAVLYNGSQWTSLQLPFTTKSNTGDGTLICAAANLCLLSGTNGDVGVWRGGNSHVSQAQ